MIKVLKSGLLTAALVAVGLMTAQPAEAAKTREDYADRIHKVTEYLKSAMEQEDNKVPRNLIRRANAIAIMRQFKFGFVFGGRGGYGIATVKNNGQWSPPAFFRTGEASFGLQIGGHQVETIYFMEDPESMEILTGSRSRMGVDLGGSFGPWGRSGEVKVGPEAKVAAYSRSKGLYAGASLEGGVLFNDTRANERFYGIEDLSGDDILYNGAVSMPPEARDLISTIEKYAAMPEVD